MGKNAHLFFMKSYALTHCLAFLLVCLSTLTAKAELLPTPLQTPIEPASVSLDAGTALLRAQFSAQVQVLSTNMYADGWRGDIAPFDLAVGWGPISTYDSLHQLRFTQADRFYYWEIPETQLKSWTAPQIILHSTNIHIVPASPTIRARMMTLRAGDKIRLTGYLSDVLHPDGLIWLTSLRRDDTGQGACEILYLTDIEIL